MTDMVFLTPDQIAVATSATGWLRCTLADGSVLDEVHCRRLFPMTDPDHYISLHRKVDGEHHELGIIRDLSTWPADQQTIIKQSLLDGHFLPEIESIAAIDHRFGMQEWQVVTGRGPKTFSVVKAKEHVLERADGSIIVTDLEKCRYRISHPDHLTLRERRLLMRALP